MIVLLEQLGLSEQQEQAARLKLRGFEDRQICAEMEIKPSAVSRLLARAKAKAAAQGVNLFIRRRTVRARSLSAFQNI